MTKNNYNSKEEKISLEGIKDIQKTSQKMIEKFDDVAKPLDKIIKNTKKQKKEFEKSNQERHKREAEHEKQSFIHTKQNKKMIKISEKNFKLSERYFYLAIATLIVTIMLTFIIAWQNNYQEKTKQINEFISEIDSLILELNETGKFMEFLEKGDLEKGMTYNEPVLENLQKAVANENIRDENIKTNLILMYFQLLEIRNSIKVLNSPEYVQIFDAPKTYLVKSQSFAEEITHKINEREMSKSIGISIDDLIRYKKCIEEERDFDKC